jgi:tetratricopeptide (TPR) repeat protein
MTTRRKTTKVQVPAFRWVRLAPLQHKRLGAVATVLKDARVLIQGGHYTDYDRGNKSVYPPDEVWDPRTNTWNPSEAPQKYFDAKEREIDWNTKAYGRPSPTLTPLGDGRILVTGGKEPGYAAAGWEVDPEPYADAFIVEKGSKKKIPAGTLCVPRWIHAAALLPDGSVMLIGGADNVCAAIADVEIGLPPNFATNKLLRAQVAGFQGQLALQVSKGLIHKAGRARHLKRYEDALKFAREAVALTPRHKDAWQELGYVYSEMGRHEDALVEYQRLLAKDRKSPFLWHFIAYTNLQLKRRREALDAYCKVVELVQEEGEDFTTQRIHEDARKQRQYLTIELNGPEAGLKVTGPKVDLSTEEWNNMGLALHQQGKNTEALPCFDRALKLDPRNDYALHNQAVVLLQLKRPKEARAALEKCIALRGKGAGGSLINLGVAQYDLGDFDASVKSYDRSIKLNVKGLLLVNAWTNRGNSLLKLKKFDRADESYGNALKVDPKFVTAWHGKVCVASAQGNFRAAAAALKKLLKLAPTMEAELRRDEDLAACWAWESKR